MAIFTMIFARLVIFNYAKGPFAAYILLYITKSWSFGTGRMRNRSNGFRLKAGVVVDDRSGSRSRNRCRVAISLTYTHTHTHTLCLSVVYFVLAREFWVFSPSLPILFSVCRERCIWYFHAVLVWFLLSYLMQCARSWNTIFLNLLDLCNVCM